MSGSRDGPLFRATGYVYTHPPNDTWTWVCAECDEEREIAQRESENHQITGWSA